MYQCKEGSPVPEGCDPNFVGILDLVTIYLESDADCTSYPYLNMDESCKFIYETMGPQNLLLLLKEPTLGHELLGLKSFLNNQNLIWFFEFLF